MLSLVLFAALAFPSVIPSIAAEPYQDGPRLKDVRKIYVGTPATTGNRPYSRPQPDGWCRMGYKPTLGSGEAAPAAACFCKHRAPLEPGELWRARKRTALAEGSGTHSVFTGPGNLTLP